MGKENGDSKIKKSKVGKVAKVAKPAKVAVKTIKVEKTEKVAAKTKKVKTALKANGKENVADVAPTSDESNNKYKLLTGKKRKIDEEVSSAPKPESKKIKLETKEAKLKTKPATANKDAAAEPELNKKELKEKRRKQKLAANYDVSLNMKKIWETLRRSDTTEETKKKLCSSLYDNVKGRISQVNAIIRV